MRKLALILALTTTPIAAQAEMDNPYRYPNNVLYPRYPTTTQQEIPTYKRRPTEQPLATAPLPPAAFDYNNIEPASGHTTNDRYIDRIRARSKQSYKEDYSEKWQMSFGAGLGYFPKFEGSDDYETWPVPIIDISYGDTFFLNSYRGAGMNLIKGDWGKFGSIISYHLGREENDATYLSGMGDIDIALESGFFYQGDFPLFSVYWDIRNDSFNLGHEGIISELNIYKSINPTENAELTLGATTSWADDEYMQSLFGVTGAQAANSSLTTFEAQAGIKDIGGFAIIEYDINDKFTFGMNAEAKQLQGDAANNPITNQGDENQFYGGTYIMYNF